VTARRCLILDLDGTVVDSHAYTFAAFRHACAPYRKGLADAEIYACFGPAELVILHHLVGPAHASNAHARLQEYYAAHVGDVRVAPEVVAVLDACARHGVARGLFTGRGRVATERLLAALALEGRFDAVVAGDDVPPKPAPDGITALLRALGRRAEETLVVGDSPLDLQAAAAAGADAALALWYAPEVTRTAAPARRLETPAELWRLLGLEAGT
jgi:HAD superfamily hydrolase (TIGR01509 family)